MRPAAALSLVKVYTEMGQLQRAVPLPVSKRTHT